MGVYHRGIQRKTFTIIRVQSLGTEARSQGCRYISFRKTYSREESRVSEGLRGFKGGEGTTFMQQPYSLTTWPSSHAFAVWNITVGGTCTGFRLKVTGQTLHGFTDLARGQRKLIRVHESAIAASTQHTTPMHARWA